MDPLLTPVVMVVSAGLHEDAYGLVVTTVSWWLAEADQGVTMSPVGTAAAEGVMRSP